MLVRLECIGTTAGRCGTGGELTSPFGLVVARFCEDPFALSDWGGVEPPKEELRVEDDLAVGTVPLEALDESEVRILAVDRLRRSLKKDGMMWRL